MINGNIDLIIFSDNQKMSLKFSWLNSLLKLFKSSLRIEVIKNYI